MKILIPFYSLHGHVKTMAEAVAEGVEKIQGAQAVLRRVPETLPPEVIEKMGAATASAEMSHIPVATVDELAGADAIIFGTPTRFGNMCGQMRQFLDATGSLWQKGALAGKAGSVFVSTGSQHGGQETTILSFIVTLMHHGMVIVGLPYTFSGQLTVSEISGGTPYGATTIAGPDGARRPSENELAGARFQGEHVARIAAKLAAR